MIELECRRQDLQELIREEFAEDIKARHCPAMGSTCHDKQTGCSTCCVDCQSKRLHPERDCLLENLCDGIADELRKRGKLYD